MKIALIGATGYVGSKLLAEAVGRGHAVTAVTRAVMDVHDTDGLAALLAGHDAVVSAYNPGAADGLRGARSIIEAAKRAGLRLLAVGGAGSLEVAPSRRLVDEPDFPQQWKAGALATAECLEMLRAEPELDWCFLSPAAELVPGERTGRFRLGGDALLKDGEGRSRISLQDYAAALLDELETPRHRRQRFSVAY